MLRMSRLTDYGTVVLACMAGDPDGLYSATDVAARVSLAPPTVSKILKLMARAGLVNSVRGAQGGYTLSRAPHSITAAQIIDALEGPVALTECSTDEGHCELERVCNVGGAWQKINVTIRRALEDITLDQLLNSGGQPLPRIDLTGALPISEKLHSYTGN
jgi:FeS assembly SUF system regulator